MTIFGDLPSHQEDLFNASEESQIGGTFSEEIDLTKSANKEMHENSLLKKELSKHENAEEKVKACIAFMAKALSSHGAPRFKDFWEGKRECLELFKLLTNSRSRSQLWSEYSSLSNEAKRLKEIKDEQASFASEQISLAIEALEQDLSNYVNLLTQIQSVDMLHQTATLKGKKAIYVELQKELNLLSTLAARINALRKELIKTEMRLGVKSKLFDRLSSCGDKVFPRRKELVKKISEEFNEDVVQFAKTSLKEDIRLGQDLFHLREEIKVLQMLAKELTLNSQTFSDTRLLLSECWDKLKELEKAKKKEFEEKKNNSKQVVDEVKVKIEGLARLVTEGKDLSEVNKLEQEIFAFMKEKELTREDFKDLKGQINQTKKPLFDRLEKQEEERKKQAGIESDKKREEVKIFEDKLEKFSSENHIENLAAFVIEASEEVQKLYLSDQKRDELERKLALLTDYLATLKQKELFNKKSIDTIDALYELLEERQERRQAIRQTIENYRKSLGGSGFDFEKAMYFQDALELEKQALDKVGHSIAEIESKIEELEE